MGVRFWQSVDAELQNRMNLGFMEVSLKLLKRQLGLVAAYRIPRGVRRETATVILLPYSIALGA